jgi:hypothetical protein
MKTRRKIQPRKLSAGIRVPEYDEDRRGFFSALKSISDKLEDLGL